MWRGADFAAKIALVRAGLEGSLHAKGASLLPRSQVPAGRGNACDLDDVTPVAARRFPAARGRALLR